eukprot:scaffold21.g2227.t1
MGVDAFLPALGMKQEIAVLASACFAVVSVVVNFWGGVLTEKKRAELQLELERDRVFQQQLHEIQSVIARYRGPLLESEECSEDIHYVLFTLAQFLGFVEVVRREGPRERPFLQAGNPQGSDTLSTLVEAVRFVLTASPQRLEEWYAEGPRRTHPGARLRRCREDIIEEHRKQGVEGCRFGSGDDVMRVSRGAQRAIGTYMITTPMGAGEPGGGRWTRVLLLQQLLVELMDLLDPDTVRLPMERRVRLMPIAWEPLPRLSDYQRRLQDLSRASDLTKHNAALEGLRDLQRTRMLEETAPRAAPSPGSDDGSGRGMTPTQLMLQQLGDRQQQARRLGELQDKLRSLQISPPQRVPAPAAADRGRSANEP